MALTSIGCGGQGPQVDPHESAAQTRLETARQIDKEQTFDRVTALFNVACAYPKTQYAAIALQQATRTAIHANRRDVSLWLGSKLAELSETERGLSAESIWLKARLMVDGFGDYPAARQLLRRLYTHHAGSPRADNALWMLADLYRVIGAWRKAHETYGILAQHRLDRGWFIGSLRSPYTAKAALLKADIEAYILDDFAAAVFSKTVHGENGVSVTEITESVISETW